MFESIYSSQWKCLTWSNNWRHVYHATHFLLVLKHAENSCFEAANNDQMTDRQTDDQNTVTLHLRVKYLSLYITILCLFLVTYMYLVTLLSILSHFSYYFILSANDSVDILKLKKKIKQGHQKKVWRFTCFFEYRPNLQQSSLPCAKYTTCIFIYLLYFKCVKERFKGWTVEVYRGGGI